MRLVTAGSADHLDVNRELALRSPGSNRENCSHVSNIVLNALSLTSEGQPLAVSMPTEHFHYIVDSVEKWSEYHNLLTVSVGIDDVEDVFESSWNADIVIVIAQTPSGNTLNRVHRGHKLDRILSVLSNGFMVRGDGRVRMRNKTNKPMLLVLRDFELHPMVPIRDRYYDGHEIVEFRIPYHMFCINKCAEEMEDQHDDQNDQRADQNDDDCEPEREDSDSDDDSDSDSDPNGWFTAAKNNRDDTESQNSEVHVHHFSEPLQIDEMYTRHIDQDALTREPLGSQMSTRGCKRKIDSVETIFAKSTKTSKDADDS